MKTINIILAVGIAAGLALLTGLPAFAQETGPRPADSRLGMNLSGPADWNTELPFADVFRLARRWISQIHASNCRCPETHYLASGQSDEGAIPIGANVKISDPTRIGRVERCDFGGIL